MSEIRQASSSSGTELEENDILIKHESKRIKLSPPITDDAKNYEKLEQRLGEILCCAVCLDLPVKDVFQCTNGHLMCAACFAHLLADARLRDEAATCPNCRVEISPSATRNLAVEKAVSELPAECRFCAKQYKRNGLERHENLICEERTMECKYSCIGCQWRGPFRIRSEHESNCTRPNSTGTEIMESLESINKETQEELHLLSSLWDLLSYEKITFNDLLLKPHRTDEFIHKLYYETNRFSAFDQQWVMKARVNNNQKDVALSCQRQLSYQLILKTKPSAPLSIHFTVLRGPYGGVKLNRSISKFEFSETLNESPYVKMALPDSAECNKVLASKNFHIRLFMFWPK